MKPFVDPNLRPIDPPPFDDPADPHLVECDIPTDCFEPNNSVYAEENPLDIGLNPVGKHRICRKVSSIPNHPLRANFPETKITRYNLRNKSPAMPAIHTDLFDSIVFKYNVAL